METPNHIGTPDNHTPANGVAKGKGSAVCSNLFPTSIGGLGNPQDHRLFEARFAKIKLAQSRPVAPHLRAMRDRPLENLDAWRRKLNGTRVSRYDGGCVERIAD